MYDIEKCAVLCDNKDMTKGFPLFAAQSVILLTVVSLLLGAFAPAGAAPSLDELKNQITERSEKIKTLEEQIRQTKGTIGDLEREERTLANEIARLDAQILALLLDIALTEERITAVNLELEKLALEIEQKEQELEKTKRQTAQILRTIEEANRQTMPIALVFSASQFSEIFDNLFASERLEAELVIIIGELKAVKQELKRKEEEAHNNKQELETLRETLAVQSTILAAEQGNREDLLYSTRRQEGRFRETLKDLEVQQREISREVIQLEAQLRRLINPSSLPPKGVLSWPVDVIRITQYYGSTSQTGFVNDQYDFHNGIDLAPPSGIGTPIYSAAPGTVAGMGNLGRLAYGRWIAIDHQRGLTTLYAHLSVQSVRIGQSVERGEVIGYEGSTGFSTGPHLHFTVYASETFRIEERSYGLLPIGASLNPLDFLE